MPDPQQTLSASGPNDLVTVVIPCFNSARFIGRTIESVLAQTYARFELIVVDDRSTDGSVELVRGHARRDPRIRLIERTHNAGAPAAPRNAGVAAAKGRWVALLDADDLWHPDKLRLQMQALGEHRAKLCSTQMKDFRDEAQIVMAEPRNPRVTHITLTQQLLKYRTPTSSIVVDRELLLAHPFNEDLSYKAREDTDCFIRLHEYMEHSIKIEHPLVFYRLQANQISGDKWKMVSRHFAMLRKYRTRAGKGLGPMAHVYTATHFLASIYVRMIRRRL
jgi:teichuronic acid biosynthesis glycosyltransferase TuaG